ncbi:MAG: pseudouridine synthase [Candidatus Saccharimonadales bacterium]
MRINKFIAAHTGLSRRAADSAISEGRVTINGALAHLGDEANASDKVSLDGQQVTAAAKQTIILNKPVGYVVSRQGQGSKTVYELLPEEFQQLKPVGRLDKDSSGLLLLTNDGDLANELTHPKYAKTKIYEVILNKTLEPLHHQMISDYGVNLDDGPSRLGLEKLDEQGMQWRVTMSEGRNRQIRRTFAALGYTVIKLHRTNFGEYRLDNLPEGKWLAL